MVSEQPQVKIISGTAYLDGKTLHGGHCGLYSPIIPNVTINLHICKSAIINMSESYTSQSENWNNLNCSP